MPMDQSITEEFPILDGDDDKVAKRLLKARMRLERIFTELFVVSDVITVCQGSLRYQSCENDLEVCTLLRRHVDNPLNKQLEKLHKVITKLGGVTEFTAMYNEESDDAITPAV